MSEIYDALQRAQRQREGQDRSTRLSVIGEVVDLYRQLENSLGQIGDVELTSLAGQAREGGAGMEDLARKLEAFRGFKQRFEAGLFPADERRRVARPPEENVPGSLRMAFGSRPLVWELLAFTVGFILTLLLT